MRALKMLLKVALVIVVVLAALFVGMLFKLAADSRGMSVSLGLQDGRLSPCPDSPNCVSSDAPEADSHYIAPLVIIDESAWMQLVSAVTAMEGVEVVSQEENYARFTFRTPVMGFTDDVELHYRPDAGHVAVRSASRVGYGDWNANRNRVESIRALQ